jgi:hypothetical protein
MTTKDSDSRLRAWQKKKIKSDNMLKKSSSSSKKSIRVRRNKLSSDVSVGVDKYYLIPCRDSSSKSSKGVPCLYIEFDSMELLNQYVDNPAVGWLGDYLIIKGSITKPLKSNFIVAKPTFNIPDMSKGSLSREEIIKLSRELERGLRRI